MPLEYVALLYSVSLSRSRRVVMADFRDLATRLGYGNPRTVLATGNLVFTARPQSIESLTRDFESAFSNEFGRQIDLIVCRSERWLQLLGDNPFPAQSLADPAHVIVRVMRDALADDVLERLEALRAGQEQMQVVNGNFWAYFPNGISQSRLAAAMTPNKMGGVGTARNWNTVRRIAALLDR